LRFRLTRAEYDLLSQFAVQMQASRAALARAILAAVLERAKQGGLPPIKVSVEVP